MDKLPLRELTPAGWRLHLAVGYTEGDRIIKVHSEDLRALLAQFYDFDYNNTEDLV